MSNFFLAWACASSRHRFLSPAAASPLTLPKALCYMGACPLRSIPLLSSRKAPAKRLLFRSRRSRSRLLYRRRARRRLSCPSSSSKTMMMISTTTTMMMSRGARPNRLASFRGRDVAREVFRIRRLNSPSQSSFDASSSSYSSRIYNQHHLLFLLLRQSRLSLSRGAQSVFVMIPSSSSFFLSFSLSLSFTREIHKRKKTQTHI
jgi:hypothetical protein